MNQPTKPESDELKAMRKRLIYGAAAVITFYFVAFSLVVLLMTEPAETAPPFQFNDDTNPALPTLRVYDGPSTITEPPFQKTIEGSVLQNTVTIEELQ